ncbi:hypothetical protein PHAVU_007G005400 [Phaseolus vulgaris]|uniref:Plastid lipid-associated protein/fibrillin conserved domain-containing protein n=1 Tax=Phaseolus vulgaris TaxID=3885 RepID=V7BDX5_PHAVU|nr:hypothetical protein PHAVU_007G005400g [Phaseolus vulgaris]ESW14646.1 hypothetical protein PHAVU_007G005400g [Phaseolus vulgaris]
MALNLLNLGFHPSTLVSPKPLKDRFVLGCSRVQQISFTESENSLIEALLGIQGRGRSSSPQQLNAVERAVQVLERLGGVPDPTNSNLIEGRWQLIFTTRPGTASPIQGTTFVLQKQTEPRQKLLTAISSGKGIKEAIEELISLKQNSGQEEPELEEGEWQMMWNSQTVTDSWIENAVNGLMGKQIIKDGRIKILVDILLGLKFSMTGNFVKTGSRLYDVTMDDAAIIGGPFGYPLQVKNKFILELLYSDEKLRVSRGYNNILFVHARTDALR